MEYQDGQYVLTNKISDENLREMIINMDETDSAGFRQFVQQHWGTILTERGEIVRM